MASFLSTVQTVTAAKEGLFVDGLPRVVKQGRCGGVPVFEKLYYSLDKARLLQSK